MVNLNIGLSIRITQKNNNEKSYFSDIYAVMLENGTFNTRFDCFLQEYSENYDFDNLKTFQVKKFIDEEEYINAVMFKLQKKAYKHIYVHLLGCRDNYTLNYQFEFLNDKSDTCNKYFASIKRTIELYFTDLSTLKSYKPYQGEKIETNELEELKKEIRSEKNIIQNLQSQIDNLTEINEDKLSSLSSNEKNTKKKGLLSFLKKKGNST